MSFDIANTGRGVFYLNFDEQGTGENKAESRQEFNFSNLVETSGSYVVSIERLVVPIHNVPMINTQAPALIFQPTGGGINFTINISASYSIKQFLDEINDKASEIFGEDGFVMSIDQSGRIRISFDDWASYDISLSQDLQDIFDLPNIIGLGLANSDNQIIGGLSIIDRFDQLYKIQVEAIGMNVQQEIITTERSLPILTDFVVPNSASFSANMNLEDDTRPSENISISYNVRQNIIYNTESARRYVMLRGNTPIQNILVKCVAIYKDNTRHEIILPKRSIFSMKVAFWRK